VALERIERGEPRGRRAGATVGGKFGHAKVSGSRDLRRERAGTQWAGVK
jgi:hypothetical protein